MSAAIRAEREHCCDDAALAVCGDRLMYAGALVELESVRSGAPRLAMAASVGDLTRRVRRVLGRDAHRRDWRGALVVCTLTGALLVTAIWQSPEVAAQAPDPSAAPVAPAARPDLAPQLKELRESTAELNLGRDASPQEAAQLQARLASRQRRLGRKQGELGRQQAELARKAQQELDELLRQAVGSGLAQRAPGD